MFFEKESTWTAPILALAFEGSTITEVTSSYRSDGFSLFSPLPIFFLITLFITCLVVIIRFLIFPKRENKFTKTELRRLER